VAGLGLVADIGPEWGAARRPSAGWAL